MITRNRLTLSVQGNLLESAPTPAAPPSTPVATEPVTTVVALDCSSSMTGEKIAEAKRGFTDYAKQALANGAEVGLVPFDSGVTFTVSPTRHMSLISARALAMHAGGSTNIAAAIIRAHDMLKDRGGRRVLLVITDGCPDDRHAAITAADAAKKDGIEILTIGTHDADRAFLVAIESSAKGPQVVSDQKLGEAIAMSSNLLLPSR